jgi:hypothetical protein
MGALNSQDSPEVVDLLRDLQLLSEKLIECRVDGDLERAGELADNATELKRKIAERRVVADIERASILLSTPTFRQRLSSLLVSAGTWKIERVHHAPGFGLLRVAEFAYSRKTFEEVFVPTIQDLQEEYAAALAADRMWKARWVKARGYWSFFSAAGMQAAVRTARKAFKMWSSAP